MSGHDLGADLADQDEGNLGAVGAAMQQSVPNMGLSIGGGDQPEADGRGAAGAAMVRTHAHSGGDPFGKQVGGPCQSRFINPVSPGLPGSGDGAPHRSLMVTLQIRNNRPDRGYGTVRGLRADTRVVSHVHHLPDDMHSLACRITSRQDRKTQLEPTNETIEWRAARYRTDFGAEMNRSRHRAPDLIMWTVRVGARVRARMGMYRGYAGGPAQAPPHPALRRGRHSRTRSTLAPSISFENVNLVRLDAVDHAATPKAGERLSSRAARRPPSEPQPIGGRRQALHHCPERPAGLDGSAPTGPTRVWIAP